MRVLLQRVRRGAVSVGGDVIGQVGHGYVLLLGVGQGDTEREADFLAQKVLELRLFEDDAGKMNRSLRDVAGGVLVVSQFTLYADTQRGRRPSFTDAAPPAVAIPLYEYFVAALRRAGVPVETGRFGASMVVAIENDGPVTLWLERAPVSTGT